MNQNFKIVIKTLAVFFLLSMAWLIGYLTGLDIGKTKAITSPKVMDNAELEVLGIPPVIDTENPQPAGQNQGLLKIPPLINLNNQ